MDENKIVPVNMSKYDFPLMEQNFTATQAVYRSSIVCVGIFLNCVVLIVVSLSRQLHYPRHIFWAAVSIFECLFLVDSALELVTVHNRDYLACRFVVLFFPADYSILLICLSMAAFDRYISIVRYEWYKDNVTNRGVIILISIVVVVTFVILTSPFWTCYKSIYSCTLNAIHCHWAFVWNSFLGIVCVILHCMIFIETKSFIRQYVPEYRRAPFAVKFSGTSSIQQPSISTEAVLFNLSEHPSGSARRENQSVLPQDHPSQDSQPSASVARHHLGIHECDPHPARLPLTSQSVNNQDDIQSFARKSNRSKISRLELQAALNLSVNILPFWLCTFPVSCYVIIEYWCIRLDTSCDTFLITYGNYFWNLFMFHSIYNPIMYMATCSEFRRALRHIAKKLSTKLNIC